MFGLLKFFFRFYNRFFSPDKNFAKRLRSLVGFTPSNIGIFKLAFYHKSASSEKLYAVQSNERLEYLGDAVLGTIVAEYLFKKYPNKDEGFLTKMRSKIVKRQSLNKIADKMGLDVFLNQYNNTRLSRSMLGNALEALVGAVYIERGYDKTRTYVIQKILRGYLDIHELESFDDNYKSQLLEWCQKNGQTVSYKMLAKYKFEKRDRFKVAVLIDGKKLAAADDFNKKSAEQTASEKAMEILGLLKKGQEKGGKRKSKSNSRSSDNFQEKSQKKGQKERNNSKSSRKKSPRTSTPGNSNPAPEQSPPDSDWSDVKLELNDDKASNPIKESGDNPKSRQSNKRRNNNKRHTEKQQPTDNPPREIQKKEAAKIQDAPAKIERKIAETPGNDTQDNGQEFQDKNNSRPQRDTRRFVKKEEHNTENNRREEKDQDKDQNPSGETENQNNQRRKNTNRRRKRPVKKPQPVDENTSKKVEENLEIEIPVDLTIRQNQSNSSTNNSNHTDENPPG